MITFDVRTLGSLPWPARLGKQCEYPGLENKLQRLLGDPWCTPQAHRHALETNPRYRAILEEAFADSPWRAGLFDGVRRATEVAQQAPLRGTRLRDDDPWRQWKRTLGPLDSDTREWLKWPAGFAHDRFTDGRHRITCLRLHHGPDLPVLVRITHPH